MEAIQKRKDDRTKIKLEAMAEKKTEVPHSASEDEMMAEIMKVMDDIKALKKEQE